jgi:hypothetical protein
VVRFSDFAVMEPDADGVIRTLVRNAAQPDQPPFLPFLYLWMAFNGWMTAVTGRERDAHMIRDIAGNARMISTYESLLDTSGTLGAQVEAFADLWPVMDTRGVRRQFGPQAFQQMSRQDLLTACRSMGVKVDPQDWVPGGRPSWAQLLRSLYRVRCNLFHGQKSTASARDHDLVVGAGRILQTLIAEAGFLEWTTDA